MSITPFVPPNTLTSLPRGNLLLQSQTLGVSPWSLTALTVGANVAADPVTGLTTADSLIPSVTNTQHFSTQAITFSAIPYTLSFLAKANGYTWLRVGLDGVVASLNTTTGAVGQTVGSPAVSVTALASGWFKFVITGTTAAGASSVAFSVNNADSSSTLSFAGDGTSNILVTDIQLEPYSTASAYAATTTAADPGIWAGAQGLPVLPFLPGQMPNVSKAPLWSAKTIRSSSGRERRTSFWPYPLWQFELQYEVIRHKPTVAELFAMWEFFNVAQGQFAPWLFVDPSDCQIQPTAPAIFGTGDGSTKVFQLSRSINSFSEPVYDPYQPVILDNGAPTASSLTFSANGVVTFGTAPASGHTLSWFGYFYFGCRFLQDDLTFAQIVNLLWSGKSLKFTSLRA